MPLWIAGMIAFGVFFWLFVLLPSWINPNPEAIEIEEDNPWRHH